MPAEPPEIDFGGFFIVLSRQQKEEVMNKKGFLVLVIVMVMAVNAYGLDRPLYPWEVPSYCTLPSVLMETDSSGMIKARNRRIVNIGFSGIVAGTTDTCRVTDARMVVRDEYGEYDRNIPVVVGADGSFDVNVPVRASRRGNDRDGRVYEITLYATNSAGTGNSGTFNVTVLHDQRGGR
jgi:hypothetical protein